MPKPGLAARRAALDLVNGVRIGGHLHADMVGTEDPSYEAMVRHNIGVLTAALAEGR